MSYSLARKVGMSWPGLSDSDDKVGTRGVKVFLCGRCPQRSTGREKPQHAASPRHGVLRQQQLVKQERQDAGEQRHKGETSLKKRDGISIFSVPLVSEGPSPVPAQPLTSISRSRARRLSTPPLCLGDRASAPYETTMGSLVRI
jgi:hypothetical protein